jgi:ribosomal protein RSM22 (predicted rRNA methylase)
MIPVLRQAVETFLEMKAGGSRRAGSQALTGTYRAGGTSAGIDLVAYLTARLPATFAAVDRVLCQVADLRPGFAPATMLDAGSGPGTATWAAADRWTSLERATFIDSDRAFLDLATELAREGQGAVRNAQAICASLERLPDGVSAELVVAAYALAELPEPRAAAAARHLWQRTEDTLVLVEPGTPAGFARIRAARSALLDESAVPVGPCTHAAACPMTGSDWCHFAVRLARSRAHMHAKGASVPFEDEKFIWLAVARHGEPPGGARVLAPPRHGKAGIDLNLCTADGVAQRHVARRDTAAYRALRKADWGDHI